MRADDYKGCPPASPVDWRVQMPNLYDAEAIEDRAVATWIVIGDRRIASLLRRRIPRSVTVAAKTWFEARRDACRYWASKGVHFSPQSIRSGRVLQ